MEFLVILIVSFIGVVWINNAPKTPVKLKGWKTFGRRET